MKSLAEKYEIILVCLIRSEKELKYLPGLEKICKEIHPTLLPRTRLWEISKMISSLLTKKSYLMQRVYSPKMQRVIDELTGGGKIDLILIDHLHMAQYTTNIPVPKILDEHNVESQIVEHYHQSLLPGLRKIFTRLEYQKLREHEVKMCKSVDCVLTVTEKDKQTLLKISSSLPEITVVPIGIDTRMFQPARTRGDSKQILFIGALNWPLNEDAARFFYQEIFPLVKKEVPDATFMVVGKRPSKALKKLFREDESVTLTGYVEDVKPHLEASAALVVPLRLGSGMRVKILEALAMGIPVVSTSIGCEGIEAIPGEHLLIAERPEDFAKKVVATLSNHSLRERMGTNAQKLVKKKYSWGKLYRSVSEITQTTIKEHSVKENQRQR